MTSSTVSQNNSFVIEIVSEADKLSSSQPQSVNFDDRMSSYDHNANRNTQRFIFSDNKYTYYNKDRNIYRISKTGSEKELLFNSGNKVNVFTVSDKYIYLTMDYKLYRLNKDATGLTLINDDEMWKLVTHIYCEGSKLYAVFFDIESCLMMELKDDTIVMPQK